jgi:hypothetical protein
MAAARYLDRVSPVHRVGYETSMRRRIAIGVLVAVVAVVAGLLIGRPGRSDLAVAGERMRAQNLRGTFSIVARSPKESFSFAGDVLTTADSSRGRLTGVVAIPGQGRVAVDMLDVGDDFWMRFPKAPQLLPHGKRWVHMVDRDSAPESLTPSQLSRMLADAGDAEKVGSERVSGVATTHYRARLDARDAMHQIGGVTEKRFERRFGGHDFQVPVEAWIAKDGLPRRIEVDFHLGAASMRATVQIARYGVPVSTHAPPPDQVIEERDWDAFTQANGQSS